MPLAVNEMDDEYLARLRLNREPHSMYVSLTHSLALTSLVAPLSSRPRFLMPSAFVRRENPKFGVEKEEGGRKGVIYRGNIQKRGFSLRYQDRLKKLFLGCVTRQHAQRRVKFYSRSLYLGSRNFKYLASEISHSFDNFTRVMLDEWTTEAALRARVPPHWLC